MNFSETDFLITLSTFIILIVVLMMVLIYGVFIKKKSELLLSQQKKEAIFEQELAISQVEIKEQTLNYIGQELHDDLGQKLSVARLMTNKISFSKETDIKEIGTEINLLVGECIQDIRNLSKIFITKQVEHFGFVDSIEREVFRLRKLSLMEVEYQNNNHHLEMKPDHALILFRIIQECINNVIKHSRAKTIVLAVHENNDSIEVKVSDDGIGFREKDIYDGSGLKSMANRAKIINADFNIKSQENKGTDITVLYRKKNYGKD